MPDPAFVYTLRTVAADNVKLSTEVAPGDAISIQADRYGNVLFPIEPVGVPADKFEEGLNRCLSVAKTILAKSMDVLADYRVETVTLKLALDAGVGVVFVGDAKIEAGIEIEIKRFK